jgi:hypothetical protein
MVIRPWQLTSARRGGFTARYAPMGPVIFGISEISAGTHDATLEAWCDLPHWAVMRAGRLGVVVEGGDDQSFEVGEAFYVPAAPKHRFRVDAGFVAAGFAPLPARPIDSQAAVAAGFELLPVAEIEHDPLERVRIATLPIERSLAEGQIEADSALMGSWVCSTVRFGPESGYVGTWCDLPHWGMVVAGSLAIESEASTELADAGDAFYIEAGPPGHRFQVTDGATIFDYTPVEALAAGGRVAEWRPRLQLAAAAIVG